MVKFLPEGNCESAGEVSWTVRPLVSLALARSQQLTTSLMVLQRDGVAVAMCCALCETLSWAPGSEVSFPLSRFQV